jgi:hypothetical protein
MVHVRETLPDARCIQDTRGSFSKPHPSWLLPAASEGRSIATIDYKSTIFFIARELHGGERIYFHWMTIGLY